MNDLIDLSAELVVLVRQAFGQILLVYTARRQPRFRTQEVPLHLLGGLIAPEC